MGPEGPSTGAEATEGNTPFTAADQAEVRRQLDCSEADTTELPAAEAPSQKPEGVDLDVMGEEVDGEIVEETAVDELREPSTSVEVITDAEVVDDAPKNPSESLRIARVELSKHDIHLLALEAANTQIEKEHAAAEGARGFMRNIWRATIARESIKAKYVAEAEAKIIESQNMFATKTPDKTSHEAEMQATIDSLLLAYDSAGEIAMREGESVERADASEGQLAYEAGVKELVRQYVSGDLDADSLQEARTRMMDQLAIDHPEMGLADIVSGDNILHVAEQVKGMTEHADALEGILNQIDFYVAEARAGVSTEVYMTKLDKLLEKVQSGRAGKWFNDATVAGAISVAYSVGRMVTGSTVGTVGRIVAPGVGAAAMGGFREHYRYKGDRQQNLRQRAQGLEVQEGQTRRERIDKTTYEMISATEATESIRGLIEQSKEGMSPEQADALLDTIAEVRLRQAMSEEGKMDLVGFSKPETVAQERLALTLAVAEGRAALNAWLETASDQERAALGVGSGESMKNLLTTRGEALKIAIDEDISDKDKIFAWQKARAVGAAAGKSALVGLGIGLVSQELVAAISPDRQGLVESALGHHDVVKGDQILHQTLLRSMFMGNHSGSAVEMAPTNPATHFERVHSGHLMKLPEGMKLVHAPDKSLSVVDHGRTLASHLEIGKDGPTPQATEQLHHAGIAFEAHRVVTLHTEHKVVSHSAHEYLQRHQEGTASVHRIGWLDNDTPSVFDKNELKLQWGGADTNGIDGHGDFVFNVSHMMPDGSSHGALSENAQALAQKGDLKLYLSATEGTQHRPFEFNIGSDGNVHIPKDGVVGHSLFSHEGGHAQFNGRYAEVGHIEGSQGRAQNIRVFATYEGNGVDRITQTVTRHVPTEHMVTTLHNPVNPGNAGATVIDAPPIIPIYNRRELEPEEAVPEQEGQRELNPGRPGPPELNPGPRPPRELNPGPPAPPELNPGRPEPPELNPGPPPPRELNPGQDDPVEPPQPTPPGKVEPAPEPPVKPPEVKPTPSPRDAVAPDESQIHTGRTVLSDDTQGRYYSKQIDRIRNLSKLGLVAKLTEEYYAEELEKKAGPGITESQRAQLASELAGFAAARAEELTLDKRIQKTKTPDELKELVDQLVQEGAIVRLKSGKLRDGGSTLGKFALVARLQHLRRLSLDEAADAAPENNTGSLTAEPLVETPT